MRWSCCSILQLPLLCPCLLRFPQLLPAPKQSQKVDKESGQALSCVNCYFMCQVRHIRLVSWGGAVPCSCALRSRSIPAAHSEMGPDVLHRVATAC